MRAAVATVEPISEPAWLARHHDVEPRALVEPGRRGLQVRTRIQALRDAGRLSPSTYEAALRFYRDWSVGPMRSHAPPEAARSRVDGSADQDGYELAWLGAMGRYRLAAGALGMFGTQLVTWCACEDRSWVWIGDRHGVGHETARDWTVAVLDALAEHYAGVDGARK